MFLRQAQRLIIVTCLMLASVGVVPANHSEIAGGPSAEVRAKLFKQVMADFTELRDCIEGEDGGLAAAEQNMTVDEVYLNSDRVPEYQVEVGGSCSCGMVNCSIYIYRAAGDKFENILEDAAGYDLEALRTSTNGYKDLRVEGRDTAATTGQTIFKFNGTQYRESKSTVVNVETGQSKPAYRRVQFRRGSSATTLQGKVSIALPDTYLLGARAGQVMTIQLTSTRKVVRFMLMTPSSGNLLADNSRSWTGSLPETGDYHIIVDADEKMSPYSITISIK